jgi:formate hydrogenlyase subunit 3/multisubunit Na+/H+ antiporter MnhD subunit
MQTDVLVLLLGIFLPFGTAVVLFFLPRRLKWVAEILSLLTTLACFIAALRFVLLNLTLTFSLPLFSLGGFDFSFDLAAGPLNYFLLLFTTGFGFFITMYSLSYMASKAKRKEYYIFLLLALGGASGVLVANHLVLFLLFWEMVSISLYFLITTGGEGSREGATKTMAILGAGDGCLLLGLGILWYLSRQLYWNAAAVTVNGWLAAVCFILLTIGAVAKAGGMPFHSWLPKAADKAPAPVMALLPASIDKLLGIYLLFILCTKVFVLPFGLQATLMIIGGVTIVAAVMMALVQHTLPRLLSYHAISQVGYMVLGLGTGIPLALAGALFHMLNNSLYKNCLFLCSGAVESKTGTTELKDLGGLAKAMPLTFVSFLIAALSISGVPLFNGFVSKWMIYQGVISGENAFLFIFLIAAMFGSALTLASFIKVLYSVFLGRTSSVTRKVTGDVGITMQIPMLVMALLCVLFGVWFSLPLNAFIFPALGSAPDMVGNWSPLLAALLMAGGFFFGVLIYLAGRIRRKARTAETFVGGETLAGETARVPGTVFYNTVETMRPLRAVYDAQRKGALDPYNWFGRVGLACSGLLKKIHDGRLPFYLLWSVAGLIILLALFILR